MMWIFMDLRGIKQNNFYPYLGYCLIALNRCFNYLFDSTTVSVAAGFRVNALPTLLLIFENLCTQSCNLDLGFGELKDDMCD